MPRPRSPWSVRLVLALLGLALCTASLELARRVEYSQQQRVSERVGYHAQMLARQLEHGLDDQVDGLRRMAYRWNQHGRPTQADWALDANFTLANFPAYQSIQWLDAGLRMRWLLPLTGNEAAQHFQLTQDHPNYNLAMQAKHKGEPHFSHSFELVQGGRGFILYTPLYLRRLPNGAPNGFPNGFPNGAMGEPAFDGFLQGVFRVDALMDALLDNLDSQDFSVHLLEFERPLYSREVPHALATLQQQVPLHLLNNQHFALQLSPTQQLVDSLSSPLPRIVLGAGLTISLLLIAALALALENRRRADALQGSNRRLHEEIDRREQVEQHLRDSRERLQLVLDLTGKSRDGLFILDPQSREILHMNQATYNSLGLSAEAFVEGLKTDPERLLPGFHTWIEQVRQAHRQHLPKIFQRELRRADGSHQAAEISAQLVSFNGHEYLIGVARDNSERLELEAQLQRLSQQDGLTGLYNRRFFDQQLQAEWRRLRRLAAPMALLMLDIDYFKAYNDTLGHLAGDEALRQVSRVLQQSLQRQGDIACRYGGEEFVILLLDTREEGAAYLSERVHQLIAELALTHPGSPLGRLSLSIGLAISAPNQDEQPQSLIAHSDQALYRAKQEGRNRTCIWMPGDSFTLRTGHEPAD
ncbi:MAG: diguanylate cyclase [Pseudomonadota bacterium]